jgi:hypothetical protein
VTSGGDRVDEEKAKARRKRIMLSTAAIMVLIPTVAMVIVNHIETEVPPPLWTTSALPVPAEADNGWSLIADYHSTTISGIDFDPIDKLLDASKSGTPLPELGRLFSPARSVASKVRKHTKICSEAFERKRMVVPCFAIGQRSCTTEPLEICARLVMFAALDDASRGSPRAISRMSSVLRQLNDAAANSPHPWIQTRSLLVLRKAIHQAGSIIKWRRVDTNPLRESLRRISETSLPVEHAVISSYLLKHLALRQMLEQGDTWLLDQGDIMRGFNGPYEVAAKGAPLPPPPDYTAGLFWWFRNPIGKKMLDALRPGADADFLKTTELRASVLERREEALQLK